jgi:succinoglycan biosynthesis transport protein ExoP
MDTDYHFQPISSKRHSHHPESLPALSSFQQPEENEQPLDLAWLFSVVRRRIWIMVLVSVSLSLISGSLLVWKSRQVVKEYQGGFRVLAEPVTAEGRLARVFLQAQSNNLGAADLSKIGSSVEDSSLVDYQTQIRVLKSPEILAPVIQQLRKKYPEISFSSLVSNLSISRVTYEKDGKEAGTKILDIRYQDKNPKKIKFVIDTLKNAYLDYSRLERMKSTQQGIQYIDSQLPELQGRVDTLQERLQRLRQQSDLSIPEITSRGLSEQSNALSSRLVDIQAQLAESKSLYQSLQRQFAEAKSAQVLGVNLSTYEPLVRQIQDIESQIAVNAVLFREDSAPMQSLLEKRDNIRALLQREASAALESLAGQIQALEEREQSILQNRQQINQQIAQFPSVLREYGDLQRELDVATDSLKLFLSKRQTLQLDVGQQEVPWTIIAQPEVFVDENNQPIPVESSQTRRQLAIAVILSLLLGVGAGFLIEVLNTVFHTPDEVKGATKLPLLGVIPFAKRLQKMVPMAETTSLSSATSGGLGLMLGNTDSSISSRPPYSSSSVLEAFRSLYTNIRLLSPHSPLRSFAIGSASSGDGKTTVAIHLAQTAAAIGQRVLLVDADLRNPQIHLKLGLPNVRGLSDAISTDIGLNDVIQRSHNVWSDELPWEDNLFVLTAGPVPSDPIKLLSSKKMLYLMEQFQAFFDLVIYDTPPLAGLADGNILAAHTDGMVIVVGLDKTDRSLVTKALDGLKISGASVLGVVANGGKGYKPVKPYASAQR